MTGLDDAPLGRTSDYADQYDPGLLVGIPRRDARRELGLAEVLPFTGVDIWNAYELSWLGPRGKPSIAIAEIRVPCTSRFLVESKSLKLYLNSFANTRFDNSDKVCERIQSDLTRCLTAEPEVHLRVPGQGFSAPPSVICIDDQDIAIDCYDVDAGLLETEARGTSERLVSHLLRSRCPVTGQPDWGSIWIDYIGASINHAALLRYLVSFRNHQGFHEQLVEQVFNDIWQHCKPQELTVYGRFTRRGGIDINPWRSSRRGKPVNWRQVRQ